MIIQVGMHPNGQSGNVNLTAMHCGEGPFPQESELDTISDFACLGAFSNGCLMGFSCQTARQTYAPGTPPATYGGNTAFSPGSGPPPYAAATGAYAANSAQPNEWYAAPGPNKRGDMCVTHVDSLRGYGYQAPCKK